VSGAITSVFYKDKLRPSEGNRQKKLRAEKLDPVQISRPELKYKHLKLINLKFQNETPHIKVTYLVLKLQSEMIFPNIIVTISHFIFLAF
jgi:hypothetical protein